MRALQGWMAATALASLAACSGSKGGETADPRTWPQERGDPTPPEWAMTQGIGHEIDGFEYAYNHSPEVLPEDLSGRYILCAFNAAPDGNPTDGARDIRATWTFELHSGEQRSLTRWGAVDKRPGVIGFGAGQLPVGVPLAIDVVDEDYPSDDDPIGTYQATLMPGQVFAVHTTELDIGCRAVDDLTMRDALRAATRRKLRPQIRAITPELDLKDQPEETRNREINSVRDQACELALVLGWDHPDVWPLTKQISALGPPTHNGKPSAP